MKNYNVAAVDINSLEVYDFIEDTESREDFQKRAEAYNARDGTLRAKLPLSVQGAYNRKVKQLQRYH